MLLDETFALVFTSASVFAFVVGNIFDVEVCMASLLRECWCLSARARVCMKWVFRGLLKLG